MKCLVFLFLLHKYADFNDFVHLVLEEIGILGSYSIGNFFLKKDSDLYL